MPHILMRNNATADGAAARRATRHAIAMVTAFCGLLVVAGLGAAGIVGGRTIQAVDSQGQMALVLLAEELEGGPSRLMGGTLYTAVACSVFVTVLAVAAGITLSAAGALAHDLHAMTVARGRLSERREIRSARWAVAVVGGVGVALAVAVQGRHLQSLTYLSLTLTAATILPACLYSLFWTRYNHRGILWTVYGGIACTVALYVSSLSFSGTPESLVPGHDVHWIKLQSVAAIAVPAGFLLGWAGTVVGRRRARSDGADDRWDAHVLAGVRAE